jgi:predicted ATPase with chaperone activity
VTHCGCGDPAAIARYRARISGPLLDRIDIHLHVPAVVPGELSGGGAPAEASAAIRPRGLIPGCSSWRGPSRISRASHRSVLCT